MTQQVIYSQLKWTIYAIAILRFPAIHPSLMISAIAEVYYLTNKVDAILLASKCSVDRIESLDLQTEEEIIHEILIS